MKPHDRLTQFWTPRIGIIVVAAMIVLTLSSLSEGRVGLTTLAATITGVLPVRVTAAEADKTAIRPFTFTAPEKDLVELRRRVQATAWPDRETVPDASQGVQLATIQALARYWATDYDWRKVEAKLNALPQFITRSMGWTSTSSTSVRNIRMRCRSLSRTVGPARSWSS